ncbi:hypothetical protein CSA37_05720 [Candidatus Fermentibacteria bacterium]|nr:MAG: hypothetical protein CSA37_13190 [Candidatus Fermentibacteria bacterium]PIE52581.1 MAG: hypothetical protein CSA37_05720 [Candidatus Fermentibacteria bacterium]
MSVFLSELKSRIRLRWTGPLFLIPILFLASLVLEAWLQKSGIMAYIPIGERSSLSLWRMTMVSAAVNTPLSALFMGQRWSNLSKSLSLSKKVTGALSASFISCFLSIIIASAAVLPLLRVPVFSMTGQLLAGALISSFWSAAAAMLCSVISRTGGGAFLSVGLFALALLPGLSGNPMSPWFTAPLGKLVAEGLLPGYVWPTIAHSTVYLLLGWGMLFRISR